MDNQHKQIKGYRDLSQEEIDLMNRVKQKGAELLALQHEVGAMLSGRHGHLINKAFPPARSDMPDVIPCDEQAVEELGRFNEAEPLRWAAIAKTDIQTGIMALVRAIAQPAI